MSHLLMYLGHSRYPSHAFLASLSWQTMLTSVGTLAGRRLQPALGTAISVLGNLVILALATFILFG